MTSYMDFAATMPMPAEVLAGYTELLATIGNPSSIHTFGQQARALVEEAREAIALAVNCDRNEVIFTGGGTESNNLAIKGLFDQQKKNDRKVIVSAYTEHHAVIDSIEWLEKHEGANVVWLPVDQSGIVDFEYFSKYLIDNHSQVALITLMLANNETGVITDIEKFAEKAKEYDIPFHTDAVAALGHIPIDFQKLKLTTMAISAHKVGGPVGVGALIVSRSAKLSTLQHGGGQERGLRSGTMNAAGNKAFAHALDLAIRNMDVGHERTKKLVQQIKQSISTTIENSKATAEGAPTMSHNAHFTFAGAKSDSLLFLLDQEGIAVSAGSACQAGVARPSHVLLAMGYPEDQANCALRITLGATTSQAEVDRLLEVLPGLVARARA